MIPIRAIVTELEACRLLTQPDLEGDLEVAGISDDSRRVKPGDLYCAISGTRDDGHRYLRHAAEAGAVAALVERQDGEVQLTQIEVENSRRAAAIAAQVVYGYPARELDLIGITGTNGKTTTCLMTRHVMSRVSPTAAIGTLGVIGASGERYETNLTTPGPVAIAEWLAELKESGARCVAIEVSSHALAQHRADGLRFSIAAFTNLTRDHLDYHADFDEYLTSKGRLVDLLNEDGTLVVNADEPAWNALPERARTLRYGFGARADYRASDLRLGDAGSSWTLLTPDAEAGVELPLLGDFNVSNALAAATIGGAFGLSGGELAETLSSMPQVPGRLEVLARSPLVIRDYAHTPDALVRAMAAVRPLTRGRLIVVFGCGGERDRGKRPLMGKATADGADFTIVTSDNPRGEDPAAIIDDILPGLAGSPFERIEDRRDAVERSLTLAEADDLVLLAGKGHETHQIIGEDHRPFDEAAIVAELLGGSDR